MAIDWSSPKTMTHTPPNGHTPPTSTPQPQPQPPTQRPESRPPTHYPPQPSLEPSTPQFQARAPKRVLTDLIVPNEVHDTILHTLHRLDHQHTLHHEWGLAEIDPYGMRTVINLYGPPGTGKTLCAEAIAGHLGQPFLDVNYAELESKYVGETAKNIVSVFTAAREQGAVLFFDEADSLLGKRLTEVRQSADYGVNQSRSVTLKQLEAHQGVVIFATNMASQYDSAFVRRILAHIHMKLPDQECRERLWTRMLNPRLPRSEEVTAAALASLTENLSGGDLINILINAAGEAVAQHEPTARHITLALLERHIARVRDANAHVSETPQHTRKRPISTPLTTASTPHVTCEPVAQSELPDDVLDLVNTLRDTP